MVYGKRWMASRCEAMRSQRERFYLMIREKALTSRSAFRAPLSEFPQILCDPSPDFFQ